MGTITLAGSRGYQDIGTIGQTVPQLAENVLSINAILDVGLRNTRDYQHGWIRVSDLIGLGLATLINGDQLTATVSSGSGTVSVSDSITGTGASATPLLLQGDASAPGNSFYYGTNGSGTKGWYALPTSGGTVTSVGFADASTTSIYTITGSPVTTSGTLTQTLTTQTANTVFAGPASGGAAQPTFRALTSADLPAPAVPGTIPDLRLWWETDNILAAVGFSIYALQERTPWVGGLAATYSTTPWTVSSTTINSLPTAKTSAANQGGYPLTTPFNLPGGCTMFIVINPGSGATPEQAVIGGQVNCVALSINTSGGVNKVTIINGSSAIIGSCTTVWSVGTPFQCNVTYNAVTGAYAFRQAQTAAGSGSGSTGAGASGKCQWIGADNAVGTANLVTASIAALIVYNRVLSGTEITNVENYLHAKWGV